MKTQLPVPDIREEAVLQHSFKQLQRRVGDQSSYCPRAPKLRPRYHFRDSNFNRGNSFSNTSTAHAISFRDNNQKSSDNLDSLCLSARYDRTIKVPYYKQCFTIQQKIGEGSFGSVYKVISKEDGQQYALKVSKQLYRSEHYRQERLEEVRRCEQFSGHENFVRFYRAWEEEDLLYMQMELCRESLESYLMRRGKVPEEKIWHILYDLLMALKCLHDRDLIHMDIKLDNVLMADDDSCKLADFGLVIDAEKAKSNEAVEGDSRYIAPELLQGHFSRAADVFSLGIAILELCCCIELPKNGILWQQLRSGILPDDFIKSAELSAELQDIIRTMMTPDHKMRPNVNQLLRHNRFACISAYRNRAKVGRKALQFMFKVCNVFGNLKQRILKLFVNIGVQWRRLLRRKTSVNRNQKRAEHLPIVHTKLVCSTPTVGKSQTSSDFSVDEDNSLDISQPSISITPSHGSMFVNSTPLYHSQYSKLRSRKALAKISFVDFDEPELNNDSFEQQPQQYNNSFLSLDDLEEANVNLQNHSFIRQSFDLPRKILFTCEESD